MVQKYIKDGANLHGSITLEKKCIANVIDMIRVNPTAARVFILLTAYASRNNTIISDVRSISKLLGIKDDNKTKSAIRVLLENGFMTMKSCRININRDFNGVTHDRFLHKLSGGEDWVVTGEKLILNFKLDREFNIFTIDESFSSGEECTEEGSNLILHLKDRLFYDTSITEEDIELEFRAGETVER